MKISESFHKYFNGASLGWIPIKLPFGFFCVIRFRKEYHSQCALEIDLSKRALGQEYQDKFKDFFHLF